LHRKLQDLQQVPKHKFHHLIHHIHHHHNLSRQTLFYIKEYGPHTHIAKTIIKESIKILLFASLISSIGGLALENIKDMLISIMPLVIMLPALNDMIGDYGTIVSSRFSTMLHENQVGLKWWKTPELRKLFLQIFTISLFTAAMCAIVSLVVSYFSHYQLDWIHALKIASIALIDVAILVSILFVVAALSGLYFYRKGEDPSNFLIPITTSVADLGNMLILVMLVGIMF
jgi:mgtE-like transporter